MTALAAAEEDAEGLEGLDGQPVAVRQDRLVDAHVLGDPPRPFDVLRVTGVVRGDLAFDTGIGGPVDVVRVPVERREATRDQGGGQPFGRRRQIVHRAEAAEALAEDGPGGAAGDRGAYGLAVPDDRVRAEARQIGGLFGGPAAQRQRLAVGGGGGAGAALVQEEDSELLQGAAEPGPLTDETICPEARTALEVEQPRQVVPVRLTAGDDLTGVQLDGLAPGVVVVQGHGETAVGEDDAGLAVADGQRGSRDGWVAGRPSSAHARGAAEPRDHADIRNPVLIRY